MAVVKQTAATNPFCILFSPLFGLGGALAGTASVGSVSQPRAVLRLTIRETLRSFT
jgi:hypothetical protein